jgi:hypothetical protein
MELHHNGLTWHTRVTDKTPVHYIANMMGIIPTFFHVHDERPAREQVMDNYVWGWGRVKGFELDVSTHVLKYPGDTNMDYIAKCELPNRETIFVYPHGWVMILQSDGENFEVSRLD